MRHVLFGALTCAVLATGCQQKAAPPAATAPLQSAGGATAPADPQPPTKDEVTEGSPVDGAKSEGIVVLDGLQLVAPKDWVRKPSSSSFVAAEFALPHAEGDNVDGRLTISTAGGGVEANIDRWKAQFKPEPKSASQQEIDISGMKATLVDLAGDFNDQRGPFAPGEIRPNYRMIAAVLPVDGQLYFIKATGPEKTIAAHAVAIRGFVQSAKFAK